MKIIRYISLALVAFLCAVLSCSNGPTGKVLTRFENDSSYVRQFMRRYQSIEGYGKEVGKDGIIGILGEYYMPSEVKKNDTLRKAGLKGVTFQMLHDTLCVSNAYGFTTACDDNEKDFYLPGEYFYIDDWLIVDECAAHIYVRNDSFYSEPSQLQDSTRKLAAYDFKNKKLGIYQIGQPIREFKKNDWDISCFHSIHNGYRFFDTYNDLLLSQIPFNYFKNDTNALAYWRGCGADCTLRLFKKNGKYYIMTYDDNFNKDDKEINFGKWFEIVPEFTWAGIKLMPLTKEGKKPDNNFYYYVDFRKDSALILYRGSQCLEDERSYDYAGNYRYELLFDVLRHIGSDTLPPLSRYAVPFMITMEDIEREMRRMKYQKEK